MITDEAEAFPRRAATILVLECWDTFQQHALQSRIYSVFSSVIPNDFDWEVKLGAVQFWDQCIFRFVNSFTNSERTPEVKECASQGDVDSITKHTDNVKILGLKTLLKLSEDHDDSVAEKSIESLLQIRRTLQGNAIALNQVWKLSSEENQNILAQFESRNLSSELELLQNSKDERTEYLCLLDDILSYRDENKTEEDVALDCY
ncbi:hypothetical protein FSP39_021980 [Pinctada imbricata]|uniref:Uncharacterized protein n=1 Tax=Pinctada imbricata TaxID=66713 RepID=A0AA88XTS3_PINIB|nr:hypothetical protein FSP39_021980 [Pinctada imbricata]